MKQTLTLIISVYCFFFMHAGPITEKKTPTSYSMVWKETSKNGGSVYGTWGGPIKDGKRNGLWKADVKFNLFGDAPKFRTGNITMTRSYKNGIPDGPYKYNYNVNFREGYYKQSAGKWLYTEPQGEKETVSGAFKDGRPDGHWSIKSTMRGGFESEMNFNNGKPIGEIRSNEYFWGTKLDVFDENGFLIQHEENGNRGINGWRYSLPDSIPMDVRSKLPARIFFTSDGVDDNYYAKGCEMFKWLQIYPYMSSEDDPIMEGTYVFNKDHEESEDIAFKEFYGGDPNWLELRNRKKNIIIEKRLINKEKRLINNLYVEDRNIARNIQSDWNLKLKNLNNNKYKDFSTRSGSKIFEFELLKEILDSHPEIRKIVTDTLYSKLEHPQLKLYIEKVANSNMELEEKKYRNFHKNAIRNGELILGNVAESIPTDIIDSLFNLNKIDNYTFGLEIVKKNIYVGGEKNYINKTEFSELSDWGKWILNYYSSNYKTIQSVEEITDDDLLLFFVFYEMLPENSSQQTLSKLKRIKNKVKNKDELFAGINNIRKHIPNTINLKDIYITTDPNNRNYKYNLDLIKNNIENRKEWNKIKQEYNKILNRNL